MDGTYNTEDPWPVSATTVLASALAAECFLFGVQSHAIGT